MGSAWAYAAAFSIPAAMVVSLIAAGPWVILTGFYVFVAIPVLDAVFGFDFRNPDLDAEERRRGSRWFDVWLWVWLPLQVGLLVWTLQRSSSGELPVWQAMGLLLSMGIVAGGGGITVAHELMHRSSRGERALAELLMLSVCYPHFCTEHVLGHHKHVGTPRDPATARYRQSLYAFLPQTLWGSLKSYWRIEAQRARKGRLGLRDARIRHILALVTVLAVVGAAFGPVGLLAFLGQGAVAVLLLETINYVEHYGLERGQAPGGGHQRVQPHHSWNSAHRLTGLYLFNLPRHSDHHFLASRPYCVLRHHDDGPQLPAGYATMVLAATIPPVWHRWMDPRVEAWRRRHLGGHDGAGLAPQA